MRALKVNPKSYGAWYHRKWVIRLGLSSLEAEFMLLKKLLKVDDRNFHGWNYRRYCSLHVALFPAPLLWMNVDSVSADTDPC